MLVLSRKQGESIHIGDEVVIVVTKIGRNRVQIGIDAPRETEIRRSELEGAAKQPAGHSTLRAESASRPASPGCRTRAVRRESPVAQDGPRATVAMSRCSTTFQSG
ncbi:carbon storage regulator [Novipirellula artificiosorum]|uniref:Translational regulator CsrA n=1 Tax=Novipirellula artificiosorum TaxID=2528016 RepID=A0A5C6DHW6_9BACT|nr:carbon storage regulator [Novipirellula artificiosorum]TWU36152.1 hypothetical protein Poly41_39050 [Novipirellula artificiosorum]